MFNFSANHLALIERIEARRCLIFIMQDHHTKRAYHLYDFKKSCTIKKNNFYCIAGKVNSADKLYLVIESVKIDSKHPWPSNNHSVADGVGGNIG
jgi:hypothetical protein